MGKISAEKLAALFKEWREDYAAGKREDAHMVNFGMEAFKIILDGKTEAPAATEKEKDHGIER